MNNRTFTILIVMTWCKASSSAPGWRLSRREELQSIREQLAGKGEQE